MQRVAADMITVRSIDVATAVDGVDLSGYISVGLHPWQTGHMNPTAALEKVELLSAVPQCLAIGEIGLDRLRGAAMEEQEDLLLQQIEIAEHRALPVILHVVRAYAEILRIRKQSRSTTPWIIHGFHGGVRLAQQLTAAGMLLSLRGWGSGLPELAAFVRENAMEKIFLETDDGPPTIVDVYRIFANVAGIPEPQLRQPLAVNFTSVFGVHA